MVRLKAAAAQGTAGERRPSPRPRTLLGQTFLLIALLLILTLGIWSQIFRYFQEPARARDVAQMVVSVVNLTRTALINADLERRMDLLIELAALEGIRIYPAEASDELMPLPDTRPMRLLTADVRRQLGEHTRFATRWKSLDGFWVSFRLDPDDAHDEYWVMLPPERIDSPDNLDWLGWGSGALLAALVGAYLIVAHISAPLRQLAGAARLVGQGERPPPLLDNGAEEIAVVARAFNQMAGNLARMDEDRALILAGVSHDLRTPLARLRLGIEMSGAPESEVSAMVTDIEEMDRIIGQFLDFGRGDPQESPHPTDLAQLAREVSEPYRLRGVNIRLDAPEPVIAPARALSIRRALANLIDNALRYAEGNTGLDLKVDRADGFACIELADRGPGIPEHEVERLRQPFTRLEQARSNTKGAGLGLAIVDRVMRAHRGRLDLLARPGGGLRAVLCLPLPESVGEHDRMHPVTNGDRQKS